MKKEQIKEILKDFGKTSEYRAIQALFAKRVKELKNKAVQEDEQIEKVIGHKIAIDELKNILQQIKRSQKKDNKAKVDYSS